MPNANNSESDMNEIKKRAPKKIKTSDTRRAGGARSTHKKMKRQLHNRRSRHRRHRRHHKRFTRKHKMHHYKY
jgi:hypothetical protein